MVGSQDVWVLGEQVIKELRHDERSFLVLIGCVAEFFLKVLIFGLEVIVIELSFGELYFNLIDLMLQELDKIVLSFGFWGLSLALGPENTKRVAIFPSVPARCGT